MPKNKIMNDKILERFELLGTKVPRFQPRLVHQLSQY